jgi:hypothetical protein
MLNKGLTIYVLPRTDEHQVAIKSDAELISSGGR